ncbi:MAG: glycosyltransferase family 87 protein, partial [Thermomicrobiales bacterium]
MKTVAAPRRAVLANLALGWLLLTWASAWGSVVHAARAGEIDFFTFLDSCDQFRRGLSLYTPLRLVPGPDGSQLNHANLNHPLVTLLLLPLDVLPREAAFWAWDALGVASYGVALALAVRALHLRLDPAGWVFLLALAATAPGVLYSLQLGQFGLLLALPVVVLWLLLRDGAATPARVLVAGALTGVLLVLKPFLLPLLGLFLARRRWPGLVAAGATGVALSLLALPFVGFGAYREWLAALHGVTWYDHSLNISLAGLLYRVAHPAPPAFVTWLIEGVVTLLGWALISRADGQSGSRAVGLLQHRADLLA